MNTRILPLLASIAVTSLASLQAERIYELWEPEPAPNRGAETEPRSNGTFPFDPDWESWSYPIGNGYMGANIFGRTDVERIQLTEKTLFNAGLYGLGGLTNFAEITLQFDHTEVSNYRRSLNLNDSMAHVSYNSAGVHYTREHFVSYPDNVLVVTLKADKPGTLNFTLAPTIPYLDSLRDIDRKTGSVTARGDTITLAGTLPLENNNYEAQIKVLNNGGTLTAKDGKIMVAEATEATLIVAAGTNYELSQAIFTLDGPNKLDPNKTPHAEVSARIQNATTKGPAALRERHLADTHNLFGRVAINLNSEVSPLPTHELLEAYQAGTFDTYLEELMFQYGRYLLIASSREKTLPAGLQGTWSQYEITPWTGGYWHNINVQMNYWGACSVNLAETFEAYINYYKAYQVQAQEGARHFLETHHPQNVSDNSADNGWSIGTGATPYKINKPGGHSGPGTGGFTTKMLVDYYEFTMDEQYLEEVAYPAALGMSRFFSKTLVERGDHLLVKPSASPENPIRDKSQLVGMPGHLAENGKHYVTEGCTFDQGFVWENHTDALEMATILGDTDPLLETLKAQLPRLDPILIGDSGQIKEWREETTYASIGTTWHRHISHLCTLYPGTLLNDSTPEWLEAAKTTLELRGDLTTGWAMAHRMNCHARLKQGERAHEVYRLFIANKTVPNLWTLHPPFQIDGNFGVMAGISEMLLQSQQDFIEVLPALPSAWADGSYDGLVARGNFVLSADWKDTQLTAASVHARRGGTCRLQLNSDRAPTVTHQGKAVRIRTHADGSIEFDTTQGGHYEIALAK